MIKEIKEIVDCTVRTDEQKLADIQELLGCCNCKKEN